MAEHIKMLEAAVQSRHHLTTSFVPLDQHNYFVSRARYLHVPTCSRKNFIKLI